MAPTKQAVRVKLLFDAETGRIMYMEAGKEFVDLLFSFLLLPTGSIIQLLTNAGQREDIGSISNVYRSAQELKECVFTDGKRALLETQPAKEFSEIAHLLKGASSGEKTSYCIYRCNCSVDPIFTLQKGVSCSKCQGNASRIVTLYRCDCGQTISAVVDSCCRRDCPAGRHYANQASEIVQGVGGDIPCGLVKENVTFLITDDLEVKQMSTIDSIMVLNKLKVEKLSLLDSLELSVTAKEALDLLEAAFTTKRALTYVFAAKVKSHTEASRRWKTRQLHRIPEIVQLR